MPLQGILKGDFSSFVDAVNKAETALTDFQKDADKVQTSLNKMADSFSGRKIIQDAELATKAIKDIGGATTLTQSEQAKLNALLNEAIAKYAALGKDAPPEMVALADATKKVATAVETATVPVSTFSDIFKGVAAGMLTATAVIGTVKSALSGLSAFIGSSIESFAAQETAVKKMTVALQAQGTATPAVVQQYKDLASAFQNTTAFSDELINEMQALLVQVGNVMPSQMDKALKAATDLSVGLGIDLRDATIVVAKAFEGNTAALKKMGISATDGESAMAAIQAKFGGQAAAEIETYAGRVKQLANAWDEVKEAVGQTIVTDPVLISAMRLLSEAAKGAGDGAFYLEKGLKAAQLASPQWVSALYHDLAEAAKQANTLADNFAKVKANAPQVTGNFRYAAPPTPNQFGNDLINVPKYLKNAEEATKRLAAETAHLKSIQDEIFGANLKRGAQDYVNALGSLSNLSHVSSVEQDKINKSIGEALDVYKRFGQVAPQAMRDLFIATTKMPDVIDGGTEAMKQFKAAVDVTIPVLYEMPKAIAFTPAALREIQREAGIAIPEIPKQIKIATASLGDLSQALSQLAQVSGPTFGGIVSSLSSMVAAANTAKTSIDLMKKSGTETSKLSGILDMATGITGIVSAAIAAGQAVVALFKLFDRNKGRDVVVDFAETFGGFDALHVKLLELGADGEALWIKLTQGVGRNNPEQAQKVIDEVTAALAKQAAKTDEAKGATEEQAQATIETATQAAKALEELGPKLDENAQQWKDWGAVVTGVLQEIANSVRQLPVASPGGSLAFGAGSGGGSASFESKSLLYLDGKQIAENTAYHLLN